MTHISLRSFMMFSCSTHTRQWSLVMVVGDEWERKLQAFNLWCNWEGFQEKAEFQKLFDVYKCLFFWKKGDFQVEKWGASELLSAIVHAEIFTWTKRFWATKQVKKIYLRIGASTEKDQRWEWSKKIVPETTAGWRITSKLSGWEQTILHSRRRLRVKKSERAQRGGLPLPRCGDSKGREPWRQAGRLFHSHVWWLEWLHVTSHCGLASSQPGVTAQGPLPTWHSKGGRSYVAFHDQPHESHSLTPLSSLDCSSHKAHADSRGGGPTFW